MKAISPLVATVLLIAFTIGVGGLVSIFVTGLTTTQTGIASNQSESLTKCAGAWLNLYKIVDATTDIIQYSNPNSQIITNVQLIGESMPPINPQFTLVASLPPGVSGSNSTGFTVGTNSSFTIRGLCQSIVTVEGVCKQGQSCWGS